MREIKFRGKRTDNGGWVYGYLSFIYVEGFRKYTNKASIYDQDNARSHDVFTDTIGQFTGLYDKNGKEIYEGDIVDNVWRKTHQKLTCKWVDSCGLEFQDENGIARFLTDATVIGNIHENPELMEAQK